MVALPLHHQRHHHSQSTGGKVSPTIRGCVWSAERDATKMYAHLIEHFISTPYTFSVASDLPRLAGHVSCKPR